MRLLSLREEANMFVVGIVLCLLPTLTSTDAAFTWIRHDASVDFVQGQTAKLVWTADPGNKWALIDITRSKVKSNLGEKKVIDILEQTGNKTKFLSGRDADIDLVVQGAGNVANVTFTLHNLVKTTDEKYYIIKLTASNFKSEVRYTFLKVLVLPGQAGLQLHSNKTVFCRNDIINMTCNALNGTPSETDLMFIKNNSIISTIAGSQSGNYSNAVLTKELNETGTFSWSCQAKNVDGASPPSGAVTITVTDPPEFTSCTSMAVVEKNDLVWTCDVSGSQPLNISWFKGNTSAVIQSGKSLSIAAVNRTNSGMYRLTASNGGECPTAKAVVYLDVHFLPVKPVLQLHPDKRVFCQGDTINIICNGVTGNPTLTTLAFLQNDSSIGMLNVTTIGKYTKTFSHALTQPGTLTFSCKATNDVGSPPTSNVVTITVKDPPVILIASCANKTVLEKMNLTLTCGVSGSLPLTISWFKGNNNTVFQSEKSLNIASVSRADSGIYRFTASNGEECPTANATVYLDVQFLPVKPVLQLQPNKLVFCQGDTINITCNGVTGHPKLTNLAFLQNDSSIGMLNVTTSGNYAKAVLSHALTQPGTLAFSCKASNVAGSSPVSDVVTITVKDPPVITSCKNEKVVEKENLTLTCDVSGSQPLNTSWFKGNTSTVIQSGKSLNILAVNRTDSGMYRFTASNGEECPTANKTVYLDVQYKPEQLSVDMAQNGFIDINKTDTINITCSAKGNPEPYYYWVFNGKPLSSLRNDTITISNAAKGNAGKYTCTAVNAVGNETIAVTVRVHYIEEATCNANPNPVKENENLRLSCSAAGYPPVTYTWTLPTKLINQPIVNETANTSLNGVNMTCTAMNSRGSKNCTKTITVHYMPRSVQVVPASVPALEINGSFNLTCSASSNPDGNYTWSLNGVTLGGKTKNVLTKDNIKPQHAGEYTCTVTNSEGSGISNKVTINVNYIGEATCDAKPNPVKENENFALICSAAGYPAVNYTWTLPGSAVYQQNTTVNATQSLNGVDMTCKAMNSRDRGSKTCIKTLTVHYKPRNVQVVPASAPALNISGSFNLTCNAISNPDGNYTWSKNGVPLVGKNDSVLTKDNITPQDAGEYTCTVTNSVGNGTSNKVTINVNYAPKMQQCVPVHHLSDNTSFVINCEKPKGFPTPNYTTLFNGSSFNEPITIDRVTKALNGSVIQCFASNALGSASCNTTLIVEYKPRNVQVVPASVRPLDINGSFNLTCNAISNPDGSYMWSKNGVILVGQTKSVFTKDNITPQDAGEYTCTVTNRVGNGTSNKVTINVNYAPKMQQCDSSLKLSKDASHVFNCEEPKGFPTPSYTTLFNGSSYNATVNISPMTRALDSLVIRCFAFNSLGSDSCNTTLNVKTYSEYGSFKCTSLAWDDDLVNPSTVVSTNLRASFKSLMWKHFERFAMRLKILSFVQGSVIVNFQIEFTANVSDPLSPLKEALKKNGGVLDGYSIDPNSIQQGIYVPPPTTTASTPVPVTESPKLSLEAIIGIVIACCVLLILVIILLVYCCYCKKRRECKDDAFAENGEDVVPMRGMDNKGSSPSPSTYAKHGPGANGNNNAGNGDDVYAKVDKSKKTNKPARSNEDEVTYAVLEYSRTDNKSGDAQLAHMPSSGKEPEKYESDYAEITGVIRASEQPKENESADNSNKNEKNPENDEKESEAEEQAKDKNQDGSPSTSQTADNTVKNDNASGSQINVETKGTSAPEYADWPSTKDRDHTTLTNVSM